MKRAVLFIFTMICCVCLGRQDIPLEWNLTNDTSAPYEVELNVAKLQRLAGVKQDAAFGVEATVDGKPQTVPVTMLPGRNAEHVILRFVVPKGTTSLRCFPTSATRTLADTRSHDNLFDGVLTAERRSAWKFPQNVKATFQQDGVLLESTAFGTLTVTCAVPVPPSARGKATRLELSIASLTNTAFPLPLRIDQRDANNRKLVGGSVTDPRWISHMQPALGKTTYTDTGLIHPEAERLVFIIQLQGRKYPFDSYGLKRTNQSETLPKLLISKLVLRTAATLPFPNYRDELFAPGVSGKAGDCALKLDGRREFMYVTTPQSTWAEGEQLSKETHSFFPGQDGTMECFFKANEEILDTRVLLDAYNHINSHKGVYYPRRQNLFTVKYHGKKKTISLRIKDRNDKIFEKEAPFTFTPGVWHHIAAQWSETKGVQLFADGKALIRDDAWQFAGIDLAKEELPNILMPHQVSVGNVTTATRGRKRPSTPTFNGSIDLLRVSTGTRYKGDFTPETTLKMDDQTRALFQFDRSFDGRSASGIQFILGSFRSPDSMVENTLRIGDKTVQYHPKDIQDNSHPDKVLNCLNYPVMPTPSDFIMARKAERHVLDFKMGETKTLDCDGKVYMDFIDYMNTSDQVLMYPMLVNKGEIDPRSFGDIADTLGLENMTPRQCADRIFNFVLGASDYFMNHQLVFLPGNPNPRNTEYLALLMLNNYCGFECGPLNNLTAQLFTCSGGMPASQTAGHGHSFETVYYDGKNHMYDLSAQKFIPAFDNTSAASLGELEREPGAFDRVGMSPDHFIRLTSRNHYVNEPGFTEKVGMKLNPGERFRMYFSNRGVYNDLQLSAVIGRLKLQDVDDYTELLGVKVKHPVYRIHRPFPHYSNAYLFLDGKPHAGNPAFSEVKKDSFCYTVTSCYPIVSGEYSAILSNGKPAKIDVTWDRGKSFRTLKQDSDGIYRLTYDVRAHLELTFRIHAPIEQVASFQATTEMMANTRVLTGRLVDGKNELTLRGSSDGSCRVTIGCSRDVKPIVIEGGVYYGTIPGHERQLVVMQPGETLTLNVRGATAATTVRGGKTLSPSFEKGVLKLVAHQQPSFRFEQIVVNDGDAQRRLTVLIAPGARLVTAKDATGLKKSDVVRANDNCVQDCLVLRGQGSSGRFNVELPAGSYGIWNLCRYGSHQSSVAEGGMRLLRMALDGKGVWGAGSSINSCSDFYKAQYGKPGERARFKWDFPLTPSTATTYPYHRPKTLKLQARNNVTFMVHPGREVQDIEMAAILILPNPTADMYNEMLTVLCGLNYERWAIEERNAARFVSRSHAH